LYTYFRNAQKQMTKSNLLPFIQKAFSFTAYIKDEEAKTKLSQDFKYKAYHILNFQRMHRISKQADKLSLWSKEELLNIDSKSIQLIAITEGWCGDAAQIIPWINQLAIEANISFKLLYRDQNINLMKEYLTNGSMSIPVIILADSKGNYLNHFGPRPSEAQQLMLTEKNKGKDKDAIGLALQNWYNNDKGKAIIEEVKAMIKTASAN